jgi:hypothetical protein
MANGEPSAVQKGVDDVGAALGLVLTAIQTYAAAKAAWKLANPGKDPASAGFPPTSELINLLGLEGNELTAEATKLAEKYPSQPAPLEEVNDSANPPTRAIRDAD